MLFPYAKSVRKIKTDPVASLITDIYNFNELDANYDVVI